MKVHEFTKIENKLGLRTRKNKALPQDLPENLIRQQLKLNEAQFSGLISCSVSRDDYVAILRSKRIINH